jgi:mono/diheme cytochrome c family protein
MKSLYKIVAVVGLSIGAVSCHDTAKPNYQFFPNMYESVGYETYAESDAFKNGKEGQLVPEGAIKRGFVPYEIPNTPEGYILAKETLKSPLDSLSLDTEKGKALFNIYCAICHGEKGNGKGVLVEREKFLGVPSYADREITDGSIFHVITYGLNAMGSHANQLSQEERWQVADYVLKLKSEL